MRLRSIALAVIPFVSLIGTVTPAMAEDGPTLYKQMCASCHDTGLGRAPTRDVLQQMTPERVLDGAVPGRELACHGVDAAAIGNLLEHGRA